MALTEGLAEALAPIRRSLDLDTASGYLIKNKKVGRVSDLFSPLFWKESSSRAYTIAGSLMLFLIDNYDLSRVKRLYMGESLESVFPNEHEAVITSWKSMVIEKYQKSKSDIEAESLYRSPGILRDVCPHAKTLLYSKHESPWQTLRQPYNWNYKNYWSWRTMINPNDRYATYKVKRAEVISRLKKKKSVDLKELAASYELPPKNTEDIELALLHHDALVASEQELRSDSLIDELKELSLNLDLSQSLTRSIWARYMLRGKKLWLGYLSGLSKLPERSDSWLENYLIFRNKADRAHLITEFNPPEKLPRSFLEQWHLLRASYYFRGRNFDLAAREYELAKKEARDGDRAYLELRRRYMLYLSKNP